MTTLISCDNEDYTGEALIEPVSGVTVSIDASNVKSTYMEASQDTIRVTATLNKLQGTADVVLEASVIDGTATLGTGEDLEFINEDGLGLSTKTIPATSDLMSTTWTIVINNDDVTESAESITIQFGDNTTANASVTPVEISFDILNYTEGDLVIDMSWAASSDIFGTDGETLSGTDIADMILTLVDEDSTAILEADGAGFETAIFYDSIPNGVYYVQASFFSVIDLGDQGYTDLTITLDASQLGVSSETLVFPSLVNTECNNSVAWLAKITKSGTDYTIEKIGELDGLELASNFVGLYDCLEPGYGNYDV
ncbi:MAG: hypothetical protein EX285_09075, partial [Thaumarchaeota archaeon]|nr:hypothetical protein [Nitrososphaerota archaeon]